MPCEPQAGNVVISRGLYHNTCNGYYNITEKDNVYTACGNLFFADGEFVMTVIHLSYEIYNDFGAANVDIIKLKFNFVINVVRAVVSQLSLLSLLS